MFSCLFVCEQDISKSCRRSQSKLSGQVGCVTRMNCLDFGEDPDPIIFFELLSKLHHKRWTRVMFPLFSVCLSVCVCR